MKSNKIITRFSLVRSLLLGMAAAQAQWVIAVTNKTLRPAANFEPLGCNVAENPGALGYANGKLVVDNGFEPGRLRGLYRVIDAGQENGRRWITFDGAGTSNGQHYGSWLCSGATMRAIVAATTYSSPSSLAKSIVSSRCIFSSGY
jgi:hypothetical protein